MFSNEFMLQDRIQKIQQIVRKYGEENFCISYSGGKDSVVLSALVDLALPNNKIPRVHANTGIELNMIEQFVNDVKSNDDRIVILKPKVNIREALERDGYPFKSKEHSQRWREFKVGGAKLKHVQRYLGLYKRPNDSDAVVKRYMCPKSLMYQFTDEFVKNGLNISEKCCVNLKEDPIRNWQVENHKLYCMVGIMRDEGGRRNVAKCLAPKRRGIVNFNPLVVVTKEWEDWFIDMYDVKICDIYYPPYNFDRTGCKGCPFNKDLRKELEILEKYFPNERKQCEIIWKPVYDEYRRIGYRLKKEG